MLFLIRRTVITDEGFRRNVSQKYFSLRIYTTFKASSRMSFMRIYIFIYIQSKNTSVKRYGLSLHQ